MLPEVVLSNKMELAFVSVADKPLKSKTAVPFVTLGTTLIAALTVPRPLALLTANVPLLIVVVPVNPLLAAAIVNVPVPEVPPKTNGTEPESCPVEPKVTLPPVFTVIRLELLPVANTILLFKV